MVFPLDEIVLRIPPECDAMKSFCTVVPNSSAWCLLISATATWPVMVLYRILDDDVSGWEYFCSSGHMLWWSHASSCLPCDPFPLCFFVQSVSPCQKMDTYEKVVLLLLLFYYYKQGNQWAESKLGKGNIHSNLISIGRGALETASTSTLSGICLLCWYQYVDNISLESAYLGEMWWYTWYTSCRQLRRDEEKTIKCHSTMDTDYIFWCQVSILDLW